MDPWIQTKLKSSGNYQTEVARTRHLVPILLRISPHAFDVSTPKINIPDCLLLFSKKSQRGNIGEFGGGARWGPISPMGARHGLPMGPQAAAQAVTRAVKKPKTGKT